MIRSCIPSYVEIVYGRGLTGRHPVDPETSRLSSIDGKPVSQRKRISEREKQRKRRKRRKRRTKMMNMMALRKSKRPMKGMQTITCKRAKLPR
jgi:hypothetical protein